jgi:hypothetical protein
VKRGSAPAILVALLAAAVAGCGGSGGHAATSGVAGAEAEAGWASTAELGWLRRFGAWQETLVEQARRIPQLTSSQNLATALTPFASCGDTLQTDVGPAPSARLRAPLRLLQQSCAEWRRASAATLGAGGAADAATRRRIAHAVRLLARANALLPPGAHRPLPHGHPSGSTSHVVPEFGRVASRLAGHRVEVRCWSTADWPHLLREAHELSVSRLTRATTGFTPVGGDLVNLSPLACLPLGELVFDGKKPSGAPTLAYAAAVENLSHEAQHARGFADEAVTECRGIQKLRDTATALGVEPAEASRLAQVFWAHYDQEPPGYATPRCHDGGPLDLHPASSRWP